MDTFTYEIGNDDSLARQQFETDFQNGNQSRDVDMNMEDEYNNSGYDSRDESFDMAGGYDGYSSGSGEEMEYDNGGRTKYGTERALTAKQMARRDARHGRQPVGVGMRVLEEAAARQRRARAAEDLQKEGVVLLGRSSNWGSKESSRAGTPTSKKEKDKKKKKKKKRKKLLLDKLAEQARIKKANEERAMENPQNKNDPLFGRNAADLPKKKKNKAELGTTKKGRNLAGPQPRAEDVAKMEQKKKEEQEKKRQQIEAARRGENVGPQGVQHVVRNPEDNPDYVKQAEALRQANPALAAAFGVGKPEDSSALRDSEYDDSDEDSNDEEDLVKELDAPKSFLEIQAEELSKKEAEKKAAKNSKGTDITALVFSEPCSVTSSRARTPYNIEDIRKEAEKRALVKLAKQQAAEHFKEYADPETREKAGRKIAKTSACRHCLDKKTGNWKTCTYCPRGDKCGFAHNAAQLREGRLRNTCGHETVVEGEIIKPCSHIKIDEHGHIVNVDGKCCRFVHHVQTETGLRKETSEEFKARVGYGLDEPKRKTVRPTPPAPSAIVNPAKRVAGISYGDMAAARAAKGVSIRRKTPAAAPQLTDKEKDKIDAKLAQRVLGFFKKGKGKSARWYRVVKTTFDEDSKTYHKGSIETEEEVRVVSPLQVVDSVKAVRGKIRKIREWMKVMRWNRATKLWRSIWLEEGKLSREVRSYVKELKAIKQANAAAANLQQGAVLPRNSPPTGGGNKRLNAMRPAPIVTATAPLVIGGKKSAFERSPKKPSADVTEVLKQMAELRKQFAAMSAPKPKVEDTPVPKVAVVDDIADKAFSEVEKEIKRHFKKQAPSVLEWLEELGVAEFDDLEGIEQGDINDSPLKKLVKKKFTQWMDEKFGAEEAQQPGMGYNWKPQGR